MARRDRFSRGGDHSGYNSAGFAAVGFRESKENYSKQHNANDTIDGVSFPYLAQNARANAAAMATLALAPPPPAVMPNMIGRQPSGYDARLRWTASPGAAGYRIFWRNAWAPDWEHELYVGNVTEYVFASMNIDDWVFGVAAVDAAGHESTVSPYVMAPRAELPLMASQKRDSDRVPIPGQVHGEVTVFQPMTILDMSERGAQVETNFPLHLDSLHDFRLSLGDRSVVVKGRIAHCKIGDLLEGSVLYRTGVEFVEPSEHVRDAIRAFVEAQRFGREHPAIVDAEIADEL